MPRLDKRSGRFYFTAITLATDARAPVFTPNERHFRCPVSGLLDPTANAVYRWFKQREKGILGLAWGHKPLSHYALACLEVLDSAIAEEKAFRYEVSK